MDNVCIYLRKSRADEEIEKELGQGETLARHKKTLLEFAKQNSLNIVKIYEEIVSGESLIQRIEMLKLLEDIRDKKFTAVLCMDIQRLGRGNMQEQGLILETFKQNDTKIITLQKTYDLNNDFDEEYSEFEAFMSRKELKMINRRLQNGRIRSIQDGNYLSPLPPYGYNIVSGKRFRSLCPNVLEAPVVKLIFDMYVNKQMGSGMIAEQLNSLGYKSAKGKAFGGSSIINILKNPVYIGNITWKKKLIKKSSDPNKSKDTHQRPKSEWIITKGKHEAIIDKNIFLRAQSIIADKTHIPYQRLRSPRNPLAGLIICGVCGAKMVYRPYKNKQPHIICSNKCGNKSSKFIYIEQAVLKALNLWIGDFQFDISDCYIIDTNMIAYKKQLSSLKIELKNFEHQKSNLHDLVERGVYDDATFLARHNTIENKINIINNNISELEKKIKISSQSSIFTFPKTIKFIDLYRKTQDINKKNALLKGVLEKIVYEKAKAAKEDDFSIKVYMNIMKQSE
ncbi:recombinase family protein [Clostridium oryzae]|uniref:Recombinase n=1 Tax=Clostridium oryzae TaxID=1450648 RepID=A0A1V4IUR0_9CLOT|nr:recombinase family protein [Clostridium oryzae]OPJ63633.1 recombinase [Clostridium oryzae]